MYNSAVREEIELEKKIVNLTHEVTTETIYGLFRVVTGYFGQQDLTNAIIATEHKETKEFSIKVSERIVKDTIIQTIINLKPKVTTNPKTRLTKQNIKPISNPEILELKQISITWITNKINKITKPTTKKRDVIKVVE